MSTTALTVLDVSVTTLLDDAFIPDRAWLADYWVPQQAHRDVRLPVVRDSRVTQTGSWEFVSVYVDFFAGIVWSHPHPARMKGTWYLASSSEPLLMIAHPLTSHREAQLRDRLAADLTHESYPASVPADAVQVLRRAGWTARDVDSMTRAGWTVTTMDDAQALASRPPLWWQDWESPRHAPDEGRRTVPARELARMLDAGVTARVWSGLHVEVPDVDALIAARPPQIPDTATRIWLPPTRSWSHDGIHVWTAEIARQIINDHPGNWAYEPVVETGPVPVHESRSWVVWSDDTITSRQLPRPAGIRGEDYRQWAAHLDAYRVTDELITLLRTCHNFRDLPPIWTGWQHATATASTTDSSQSRQMAAGVGQVIEHTITIDRHTITLPDETEQHVWTLLEVMNLLGQASTEPPCLYWQRSAHLTEASATAERAHLMQDDQLAYPLAEAAPLVDMTHDALRQAIHRAGKNNEPHRPRKLGTTGLYSLAHIRRFLAARTGPTAGPGRGHRRTP